jgi:hypothetical protein
MFANEPAYFFYAENRIYVNSTITVDRTGGSIVLQGKKGSIVLEIYKTYG